ncbi:MAG: alpha-galactosidase [Pedobacter sp.]|nr:MAG: alpha-galactosidase [Pedobacter sp.]
MNTSFNTFLKGVVILLVIAIRLSASAAVPIPPKLVNIPYGNNSKIIYDQSTGLYDLYQNNKQIIKNAFAEVKSGDQVFKSLDYKQISFKIETLKDQFGKGKKYIFTLKKEGVPTLKQVFFVYPNLPYFFTEVLLLGNEQKSNYMSPLSTNNVHLHSKGDNRNLFVPFDNDTFIRYDAKSTLKGIRNVSAEVAAFYDNTTRKGLIVGSVEHMVWKTGIASEGKDDELNELKVFGGYSDKQVTRDQIPHAAVSGDVLKSPKIFVGYFNDWRTGFEAYGKVNRLSEAPFVFNWTKPVPFGWNSWGVIQEKLSYEKAIKVIDYFADKLPDFRNGETAYIDLDSFWDNFTGGMKGDFRKLKEFADYCKSKGMEPGVYWAPFTDWGFKSNNDREAEGSTYKFSEMWTKVGDGYHDFDGARALDPTHPGTQRRIDYIIDKLKACGFKMIKIDFLGHAAAESTQFYDPKISTGMQAYRVGMEYLVKRLDGQMLIYAAISPSLATGRYAHTRRIACDAWKTIKDTEYTLNSVNYGWWQTYLYNFIDADHVVFSTEDLGSNKARFASGLITGTLITGDDFSIDGQWDKAAQQLLQNKELLDIARSGKAFMPLNGNTGENANPIFYKTINGYLYIALFNYTKKALEFDIPFSRIGLKRTEYAGKELFDNKDIRLNRSLKYSLSDHNAAILKINVGK